MLFRSGGRTASHVSEDSVPLSEEELRLLEQMERALSEEDPKFASTLRGTTLRQAARRRAIADTSAGRPTGLRPATSTFMSRNRTGRR